MKQYGSKGLAIFQVINDGTSKGSTPTPAQLKGWVSTYKAAGASGLDPRRNISRFYYTGGATSIPYNFILDAKTRKILEKKVSASAIPSMLTKYLP